MKLIYDFTPAQLTQVHQLYAHTWWGKSRTLEDTMSCIEGSQICIGVIDQNQEVVGFARAISDFIFKAIIFDVIVCPSQRGCGLGSMIIRALQSHEKLKKVKHFELYCLPEMEKYYEQFGFSRQVGGIRLMRRVN
ncbi:GNAT family N-acetyltransferase [Enterovibrio coralii]|uniref:GCN5 family acetyltransferase n=1 Tax=Enterovibrio coralii TaxID=294935 RepID=A0A135I515_9GAMM|nr:GNAT family N-acetyltransferase [Enterovibrio coralii]KXF80541.1 GCN5 family acetyltransferase [Enterovibrio coralii]